MISEKQKECQDLVDKINKTFNVSIDNDNKCTSVVWFRAYIIDKFKDEPLKVTYEPLKKHHSAIQYIRKELPKLRLNQKFIDICKVVETMDINLYKEFLKKHVKKRYDKKNIEVYVKKIQLPTQEAMMLLRKNQKSNLWNKRIKDWNYSDWSELRTY